MHEISLRRLLSNVSVESAIEGAAGFRQRSATLAGVLESTANPNYEIGERSAPRGGGVDSPISCPYAH